MPRLIDLSHPIEDGMITYKGLPAPVICGFLSREASRPYYADGTEFHIGKVEMVANTGTYLDSPFHRFADGMDLRELPLRVLASLDGVVIRKPDSTDRAIGPEALSGIDVTGKAVLFHTGWDRHWRTDQYFEGHPYLAGATAIALVESGALLVEIDSLNIDDIDDLYRPVHTTLLGAGNPIVEHMTDLGQLPDSGFLFSAAPAMFRQLGSFPVRAFAEIRPQLER